jgi:hypothetical protein
MPDTGSLGPQELARGPMCDRGLNRLSCAMRWRSRLAVNLRTLAGRLWRWLVTFVILLVAAVN